jgi:class 3 adenylate cyclase
MASTEEFVAAGLYDPETQAECGRLEMLEWFDGMGFSIDEMVAAEATGALGAMAGDRRLVPGERLSRAAAIELAGIDSDAFDINVRAFGFSAIQGAPDGEIGITAEEARSVALFQSLGGMFSEDEAISFLRVLGSAMSRIADAAVSLFLVDVESRLIVDGSTELELARTVDEAVGLIDGFAARLDPILRRHMLQAIERTRRSTIDETERFQYRYAIGFVDLVGFTAITAEMSARDLSQFLREFEGRAYDVVSRVGARVVKLIGDEVMFVSADPAAACSAASELMWGFGAEDARIVPRGGLAYGDVLVRGGDYYGSIVNLASRLVGEAVPQELLVTEPLATAFDGWQFEPAGRRMLKGFDEPIPVRSLVAD